jgi:hypothetical protein
MSEPSQTPEVGRVFCYNCKYKTDHTLLHTYFVEWKCYDLYEYVQGVGQNHNPDELLFADDDDDKDDYTVMETDHEFLRCNVCQMAVYRRSTVIQGESEREFVYFPKSTKRARPSQEVKLEPRHREPNQFPNLPPGEPLWSVYRQTVAAFNERLLTLAGAGVRLIIEGICKDQKIEDGEVTDENGVSRRRHNLAGRINGLVEHGFIS